MSDNSFTRYFKNIWEKYRSLKKWQQIGIGLLLFAVLVNSSSSTQSENSTEQTTDVAETSSPAPSETTSVDPSPEPTESASPDAPIDFRFSALRDLGDMRKDLKEARAGITADGLGRYYWNVAEVEFNMAQLESLVPKDEYAAKWVSALEKLRSKVDLLNPDDDSLTISKAKSGLDNVLKSIAPLEAIARTIAN